MGTIFNRTNFMISDALIKVLKEIEENNDIKRIPQEKEGKFAEAPKVDGNFRIRWNTSSVFEIEQLIRACNPFYNAFTFFRGVNIKIIKATAFEKEHDLKFGQIALSNQNNIVVAGRGGYLSLDIVQIGTWGILNPHDFYYIFSPKIDEILM